MCVVLTGGAAGEGEGSQVGQDDPAVGQVHSICTCNLCHSAPLEMLFPMNFFFAEVKLFIFWPKTMDYSPWFHFWESKKSSEKRIP